MSINNRDKQSVWHPYAAQNLYDNPIAIDRAEGAYLYDENGNKILDAISSWWTTIHGHSHPYIAKKVHEQLLKLEHVIFSGFTHEPAVQLAERLLKRLPKNQSKVFYSDNGSTAVEVGIKMAIQYWFNKNQKRTKIIAFKNSYHGDTFGAMSVSARNIFNNPFNDLLFDVIFIDVPTDDVKDKAIADFKKIIFENKNDIAAFVFEPLVLGTAGMVMYSANALDELIFCCNENNIITIADEVMTGFGRTGKFFASDYLKNKPDVFCLSKGLTGGTMAMGVTACTENIYQAFITNDASKIFFHGHSYTANPVACSAALASMDLFDTTQVMDSVERISAKHIQFLNKIQKHAVVKNSRATGTILAIELITSDETNYLNAVRKQIYNFFLSKNILLRPIGNVIYILPPYCITDDELDFVYTNIEEFLFNFKT